MRRGQIDGEGGVVALVPMGPCDGERLVVGMGMPGLPPFKGWDWCAAGIMAARAGQ
jgi:hypothetical protein